MNELAIPRDRVALAVDFLADLINDPLCAGRYGSPVYGTRIIKREDRIEKPSRQKKERPSSSAINQTGENIVSRAK